MKPFTIRLDDESYQKLIALQKRLELSTLNSTIKVIISQALTHDTMLHEIRELFLPKAEVDQEAFQKLNEKYGLMQTQSFK